MVNTKLKRAIPLLALFSGTSHAAYDVNIPPPQTIIAEQIYDLHLWILVVCAVIFVVVFGWMFLALLKHRKSVGHKAEHFHENTTVEIIWTIIPFMILVGMAYPATKTVLAMKDASSPDLTIKVTGYQWKWEYDYQQDGIRFYSNLSTPRSQIEGPDKPKGDYLLEVDNPMVVPVGKKVRLLVTANDVIHGWYVPQLGVNQYGIPGFIKDTWIKVDRPGTYKGQCSQICGKEHGYMPVTVVAKTEQDYAQWVKEQKARAAAMADDPHKAFALEELKARGQQVYAATCAACHQASGQGVPDSFPALDGSQVVTGPKEAQIALVLAGKNVMPAFGKQLSDTDIAAAITYTRNAWGNQTGDMVQPSEVKAARQ